MKAAIGWLIGLVFVVSLSAEPLFEGQVRLESGEPVADAQVRIFDLSDLRQGAIARAMTDGTGYFALPLVALGGRALPARFALGPNYPNPFNPSTIIPYQLAASSAVRLEVFNLLGQRITTLVDGERPAGFHTATWHATDGAGRAVGAGVYIYRMTVGVERQTGRMVLIDGQAGVSAGGAASVIPGASGIGGLNGADAQVYGLIVSGSGLVPYVDSSFRVEAGMAPVELVVSSGLPSSGKATDDDCAFCDLFGTFNDQQEEEDETEEEEAETDSTSSEGGPDLIVQSPSVSAVMLTPGQEFTLNVTVHNQGDEQAAATMLHYYRSNNATITSSDTEVGTDAVGVLDASATSASSIALTVPTSVSAEVGIYYGACVASVSGESNTDNNCSSAVKITVSGQESPEEETQETPEEADETPEEEGVDGPVTIPDANLRVAIEAALGKASGAPITVAEMKTLTHLWAIEAGISDLTGLEFATNLRELNLSRNNVTDISALGGLTKLTYLDLGGNNITDISVLESLTNLKVWLSLSGNRITDISVLGGLTNLVRLDLGFNNITDISVLGGLTKLEELFLRDNSITDISALGGLTKLKELFLRDNSITDISALGGLTKLTYLELRGNSLNDSSVNDHIPALKSSGVIVLYDFWRVVGDFDIELVLLSSFTERQKEELQYGIRRWMAVITKDLPDYTFTQNWLGQCGGQSYEIPAGERIDDLRIYVSRKELEGLAGYGGPALLRAETHLPVFGCMVFNSEAKNVQYLTLHETAHVLGVGTIWDDLDFLQDYPDGDVHFNGPLAIAAFDDAGGRGYTGKKVPVSQDGGHWRSSVFGTREVMISGDGVLSAITVQSLADLGYGVDVTQAGPYTLPGAAGKASAKIAAVSPRAVPELSCGVDLRQEPIYVIDPQGRIIRTLGD